MNITDYRTSFCKVFVGVIFCYRINFSINICILIQRYFASGNFVRLEVIQQSSYRIRHFNFQFGFQLHVTPSKIIHVQTFYIKWETL
jgi:hypothetical protein